MADVSSVPLIIWADATKNTGLGHLGRCLQYAKLHKDTVHFIGVYDETVPSDWRLNFSFIDLPANYSEENLTLEVARLNGSAPSVLLIDHYRSHESFTKALSNILPVIHMEDWPHRTLDVDAVLSPVPVSNSDKKDYERFLPDDCYQCFGLAWRARTGDLDSYDNHVISAENQWIVHLGGVPASESYDVLELILTAQLPKSIDVLVSKNRDEHIEASLIRRYSDLDVSLEFKDHVADYLSYARKAKLVIGAAGVSAWERLYAGIPQVLLKVAENQSNNFETFLTNEWARCVTRATLLDTLEQGPLMPIHSLDALDKKQWHSLCYLLQQGVSLRPWVSEDVERVFQWQQQKSVRQYARNPKPPTYEEHRAFFLSALSGSSKNYIVLKSKEPVGVVRVSESAEISIYFDDAFQGQGLGKLALTALQLTHIDLTLTAFVQRENSLSRTLFRRVGFETVKETDSGFWYEWQVRRH